MNIVELIKDREAEVTNKISLKEKIDKIETQLNDLPFYAEYISLQWELNNLTKSVAKFDKTIYSTMEKENLDKVIWDNFCYKIVESPKASIKVVNEDILPDEAFKRQLISKTELWKLIDKYELENKSLLWVERTYSKSLKII